MLMEEEGETMMLNWLDLKGLDRDNEVNETKVLGIVGRDSVHLIDNANRCAVSVCQVDGSEAAERGWQRRQSCKEGKMVWGQNVAGCEEKLCLHIIVYNWW